MIAILSTTYESMCESGSFQYKRQLFNYCERFMLAFETPTYGELVIHAPPLNIFCILLVPFTVNPKIMEKASKYFSYMMYWIENSLLICCFIGLEFFIYPLVFLKSLCNVVHMSLDLGICKVLQHIVWFLSIAWLH